MAIAVKAVLTCKGARNGVIRRFSIPEDAQDEKYEFVTTKVAELFTELKEGATTKLRWKDEDGDMVVFSSKEEIQEAIKSVTEDGTLLIHVTEIKQKKTTQPVLCKECEEPVTGPRYVCTVCPDYNLCDTCEAAGHHTDHVMIKMVKHDMEKEMEFPVNSDGEFVPPPRFRRWMNRFTRRWHQRNGCCMDHSDGKGEDLNVGNGGDKARSLHNKSLVVIEDEGGDKSAPRHWRRRMRIALQRDSDGSRCMGRRRRGHLSDEETGEETSPIRGCRGGHQRHRHCSRQGWGRRMRCGNGGWRRRARMMTEKEDMGVGFESEGRRSRPSHQREDIFSTRRRNGRCQLRRMRRAMRLPNLRVRMEAEAPRRGRSLSRRCLKRMRLIKHGENVEGCDRSSTSRCRRRMRLSKDAEDGEQGLGRSLTRRCRRRMRLMKEAGESSEEGCDMSSTRRCRRRMRLLKDAKDGEQGCEKYLTRQCRRRMRLMKKAVESGEEGCDRSPRRCRRRMRLSKDEEDGEQGRGRSLTRRCRRRMRLMKEAGKSGEEGCDMSSTRRCRRRMRLLKDAEDGEQGRGRSLTRRCRRRMRLMKEAGKSGEEGCDMSSTRRCRRRMRLLKDAEDGEQGRDKCLTRQCRRRMRLMKKAVESGEEGCDRSPRRCRRRMRLSKDEEDGEQGRGRSLTRRCRRRMRLMKEAGKSGEEGCDMSSTRRCRRRMRLLKDAEDGEQGRGRSLTRRCRRRMRLMKEAGKSGEEGCDMSSTRRCRRRMRLLKDAEDGEQGRDKCLTRHCRRRMRLMKKAGENGEEGCDRSPRRCRRRMRLSKDEEGGEQGCDKCLARHCRRRMRLTKKAGESGEEGCDMSSTRRCRRRMRLPKNTEDGGQGRGRYLNRCCRRRMKEARENDVEGCVISSNRRCRRKMLLIKEAEDGEQGRGGSLTRRSRRRMRLMRKDRENGVDGCGISSTRHCRRRMRLMKGAEVGEQGLNRSLTRRCSRRMRLIREAAKNDVEGCFTSATRRCRRRICLLKEALHGERGCSKRLPQRCYKRRMMKEIHSDKSATEGDTATSGFRKVRDGRGSSVRSPTGVRFGRRRFTASDGEETEVEKSTKRGWGKEGGRCVGHKRPLRGGRRFWRRLAEMMEENAPGQDDSGLEDLHADRLSCRLRRMETRDNRRQFLCTRRQMWSEHDVPYMTYKYANKK